MAESPVKQLIDRSIREKIVLVGVALGSQSLDDAEVGLDELALLVETAGAEALGRVLQRRDVPDATWFIGKGKAEELRDMSEEVDADTVVFDTDLAQSKVETWRSSSVEPRSIAPP